MQTDFKKTEKGTFSNNSYETAISTHYPFKFYTILISPTNTKTNVVWQQLDGHYR